MNGGIGYDSSYRKIRRDFLILIAASLLVVTGWLFYHDILDVVQHPCDACLRRKRQYFQKLDNGEWEYKNRTAERKADSYRIYQLQSKCEEAESK